jgi:hypothetical protein
VIVRCGVQDGSRRLHHARLAEFARGADGGLLQMVHSELEAQRFLQVAPINEEPYLLTACRKHGAVQARWSDVLAGLDAGGGTVVATRAPGVRSGA